MSSSEDDINDVQDLISRYRTGHAGGSPATKKRERTASPDGDLSESADSAKRPMKDDQPGSGKFILRAAKPAHQEALDFIQQILTKDEDPETDKLISIIQGASPTEQDDVDRPARPPTAVLVRQFENLSEDVKSKAEQKDAEVADHEEEIPMTEICEITTTESQSGESDFDSDPDPDPDPDIGSDSLDQPIEAPRDDSCESDQPHLYDNVFLNAQISYIDESDEESDQEKDDHDDSTSVQVASPQIKFEPAQEPEQKKVKGFQDGGDVTMVTEEGLSRKEQLSRGLQEKDIEDVEESEDTLGSLNAVAAVIKKKAGDSSGRDKAELDFSVIQSTQHLNVEASKQRVELRQKGSLAQRRRPTRTSMRHKSSSEDDLYEDSTEPKRQVNGHRDDDDEFFKPHRRKEQEEQISNDQGPVLRTGKTLQGIKTPILLPGLAEGRAKLRSSKPVVPLPKKEEKSDESTVASPAWLSEARLRQTSRPPRGETEKLQQEKEPETPAWMKDAFSKKRNVNIIPKKKKVPTATLR